MCRSKRIILLHLIVVSFCSISAIAEVGSSSVHRLPPIIAYLIYDESNSPPISSGAFLERDGLVVVEMESLEAPDGWQLKCGDGALGSYLEWGGQNSFGQPGMGLISVNIAIDSPGTYRFMWRNSIREGTNTTESNDSWLRIITDNFFGFKEPDSTVCPRDQLASNRCTGQAPNGTSRDGWLKVYRSGGPADDWRWSSFTSDSDAHRIYAEFDQAGEYEIQISGRSKHHAIDRLVLFRERNSDDNVDVAFATDEARSESDRAP